MFESLKKSRCRWRQSQRFHGSNVRLSHLFSYCVPPANRLLALYVAFLAASLPSCHYKWIEFILYSTFIIQALAIFALVATMTIHMQIQSDGATGGGIISHKDTLRCRCREPRSNWPSDYEGSLCLFIQSGSSKRGKPAQGWMLLYNSSSVCANKDNLVTNSFTIKWNDLWSWKDVDVRLLFRYYNRNVSDHSQVSAWTDFSESDLFATYINTQKEFFDGCCCLSSKM